MISDEQEQLAAFMDGELEGVRADRFVGRVLIDPGLRRQWEVHYAVRHAMHGGKRILLAPPGFASRLAASLEAEPAILAPGALVRSPLRLQWVKVGSVAAAVVVTFTLASFFPRPDINNTRRDLPGPASRIVAAVASAAPTAIFTGWDHRRPSSRVLWGTGNDVDVAMARDIQRLWSPMYMPAANGREIYLERQQASSAGVVDTRYTMGDGIELGGTPVAYSPQH